MLQYPKNYQESKTELKSWIQSLKKAGVKVDTKSFPIEGELVIDKVTIKSKKQPTKRLVLTLGLHGIEGYVGHACLKVFLNEFLGKLSPETETVIYHPLNPYGMSKFRRTNENNVDLNRNFSQHQFSADNIGYQKAKSFFEPRKLRGHLLSNLGYYGRVLKVIAKYGVSSMKEATLMGQKIQKEGLYYSAQEFQKSTQVMISEIPKLLDGVGEVVWVDLHTGYGPRYQMSVVNSVREAKTPKEVSEAIQYPLVLGLNKEDFYEIDGDMIEWIYVENNKREKPIQLYATCFEFGTLGDSTLNSIESLKAMVFENSDRFHPQSKSFSRYANRLMREQYLPSSIKWKEKAEQDFHQAFGGILRYKGFSNK